MTGSLNIAAMFRDSWKTPLFTAPSPKKHTETIFFPSILQPNPAPTAIGIPPPTIPFAPNTPTEGSAICMEPPLPLQQPVAFPNSSATIFFKSTPFAIQWP